MIAFRSSVVRILVGVALVLLAPSLSRADVHGGIEIGAKGIRAITVDIAGGDAEPKILMIENKNTTLVADLAATKKYSPKALDETAEIVGRFAKNMRDEFKVPDARIYVVGSSGIFVPVESDAGLVQANKEMLVKAIQKTTGLTMDFVSITREAELTITSIVPPRSRYDAVLLDIGSGNTKGGAEKKDAGLLTFGIPFGTVSFHDRVKKDTKDGDFVAAAIGLRKDLVLPKLKDSLQGKTELAQRKKVYLAGGTVWAMATFTKPADRANFVAISASDIHAFHKLLVDNPKELPTLDLKGIVKEDIRKLAAKDVDQVRKTFSRDQLVAGVEILKALSEAFQLEGQDKQIYFARNAYIGWILGYTLEKGVTTK